MRGLIASCFVLALAACSREPSTVQPTAPPETKLPASAREVTVDETETLLKTKPGLLILDMRVETEWAEEGHIPGAQLTNYYRANLRERLDALDHTKPSLVYCAIGERARLTAVIMGELGFKEIHVLKGGLNAWKAAGKAVVK
ncbi:MAG: rhodanese-like domain-containing protein [Verrucomicrobiaceae bacterium]|nr:rhodanese-like domain-containing protein [Verrucomicrobiaceae bacterium]